MVLQLPNKYDIVLGMKDSTDEILKRIQARIDAAGNVKPEKHAPETDEFDMGQKDSVPRAAVHNTAPAIKLKPEQITGDVFIIAPTQIEYIAEIFGDMVADGMNMRAFAPRIRKFAYAALREALMKAKKQGA